MFDTVKDTLHFEMSQSIKCLYAKYKATTSLQLASLSKEGNRGEKLAWVCPKEKILFLVAFLMLNNHNTHFTD